MSETHGSLRSAADHLDDARTDLAYGDLEGPSEEHTAIIENMDEALMELESTMKQLAVLIEATEEVDPDE